MRIQQWQFVHYRSGAVGAEQESCAAQSAATELTILTRLLRKRLLSVSVPIVRIEGTGHWMVNGNDCHNDQAEDGDPNFSGAGSSVLLGLVVSLLESGVPGIHAVAMMRDQKRRQDSA